jgi:hypothetical protein
MGKQINSKASNKSKRELRLEAEVGKFVQQYARKRQKGFDPNDRTYDRKIEKKIRKMDAQTLDMLLNDSSECP